MSNKIRIFVGSEPKTFIPKKVLEFSILEQTKKKIEFCDLDSTDNWTTRTKEGVHAVLGTGFSLLRWDIPRRCNYEGYAIYLDADILALTDIAGLWQADVDYPNDDASVWCTYQPCKWFTEPTPETSVMFIDCKKAKENQKPMEELIKRFETLPDPGRKDYVRCMRCLDHPYPPQQIPNNWNALNKANKDSKFLHYTGEAQQPWFNPKHPFRMIWQEWLQKALAANYIEKKIIKEAIQKYRPHTNSVRGEGLNPHYQKIL